MHASNGHMPVKMPHAVNRAVKVFHFCLLALDEFTINSGFIGCLQTTYTVKYFKHKLYTI